MGWRSLGTYGLVVVVEDFQVHYDFSKRRVVLLRCLFAGLARFLKVVKLLASFDAGSWKIRN